MKEGQSHGKEIRKGKVTRSPWQIITGLFSWQITLSTGTAAEVGWALERSNSPVLSMRVGTDSDAFSTEASSLTLAIFITSLTFVFNTEIVGTRLHTLMIHW